MLACGPRGALNHPAAVALWEIRPSDAKLIDVTVRTAGGRSRPGLRIRRAPALRDDEVTTRQCIPVTPPARTLLDLAAILQPRRLERALDRAEILEVDGDNHHGHPAPHRARRRPRPRPP